MTKGASSDHAAVALVKSGLIAGEHLPGGRLLGPSCVVLPCGSPTPTKRETASKHTKS
jgi:hypothetical protein